MKYYIIFIMMLMLTGCGTGENVGTVTNAKNSGLDANIATVEHDGHKFVILVGMNGKGGILHHPSCECLNKKD